MSNSFSLINDLIIPGLIIVSQIFSIIVPVFLSVAFLVYAERKVLALIQLRRGPNIVGPFGLFQSFADALKLLVKENIIPRGSNKIVFLIAPIITMVLSLIGWVVIPFAPGFVISDINVGIMYLFAVSNANQSKSFQVVSAFELTEAEKKAIVDDLTSKHKTTVTVDTVVDETLKGGVIIKEGDKVIDTSIKAKVDALSVCLSVN